MLLEIAIGDAYGAGFEFCPPDAARPNDLSGYVRNARLPALGGGRYTDDAQMALSVAEAMLEDDPWTEATLWARFAAACARDPRPGYSARMLAGFAAGQVDRRSATSGAAMRAAPIGLFADPTEVEARARAQAAVTHDAPEAAEAAAAVALAAHFFAHRRGRRGELPAWLAERLPGRGWHELRHVGPVPDLALGAARAALALVAGCGSAAALLRECVGLGGDVDTAAAIALGVASGAVDVDADLPRALLDDLEGGPWGRDLLCQRDRDLLSRYGCVTR